MAIRIRVLPLALSLLACGLALPAQAQTDALRELDELADVSANPQSGLARAREQLGMDDLTGAIGTLERLLMLHPESDQALLLHATLLCRIDDKEGARVEFAELARNGITVNSPEVVQACGPMPRAQGGY